MPWHKVNTDNESKRSEIEAAFESAFMSASTKRVLPVTKNAVLYCTNVKDSIRNQFSYYFSPDCSLFFSIQLNVFGATECLPPEVEKLTFLCGDGNAKP